MSDLRRILVGVDLLESRQGNLSPPVEQAVKQAIWLAERLSSQVLFLAAVELPKEGEIHPPAIDSERVVSEVETSAREALRKLVQRTAERGVRATSKFVDGQGSPTSCARCLWNRITTFRRYP
ncbi:MAG TPA: universal stress protein [Pirellulales bacterium]|nr:universal stress protein [Pirellulales bacterium]